MAGVELVRKVLGLLVVFAAAMAALFFVGGYCWEYTIETWAAHIRGNAVDVPFYLCGLLGIPLAPLGVLLAIATAILICVL